MAKCNDCEPSRRDFLTGAFGGLAGLVVAGSTQAPLWAQLMTHQAKAKACILLYMGGGQSQLDTWDPKPGKDTAGPLKSIATSVTGIHLSQNLPKLARQMDHLAVIRSMTTSEGSHERARYLIHTGYKPNVTVKHPGMGSIVWNELGDREFELPQFVAVGGGTTDAGFLGPIYNPFTVQNPSKPPENLYPKSGLDEKRLRQRLLLLKKAEKEFVKSRGGAATQAYHEVHEKAGRMMTSKLAKAFDLSQEKAAIQKAYGQNRFGQGCLMARRLVEVGVKFVEVNLGGWDNHRDIFNTIGAKAGELDSGMGTLIAELQQRRMLDETLVICMGDFGRTPKINANSGRDHYPRAWSVAMAGGGVKGGQIIGSTDDRGFNVSERPVKAADLCASVANAFGINPGKKRITPAGRPITVVDKEGEVIKELFS